MSTTILKENILMKSKIVQAKFIGKERIHNLDPKAKQSCLIGWPGSPKNGMTNLTT